MSQELLSPEAVAALFTGADGAFRFARWGRPIVPVVFGVEDQTLEVFKGAVEAVVTLAGHKMAETDPELGANLMVFFCRDWAELSGVPNLGDLVPGLEGLVDRLIAAEATQYRTFRVDEAGAIKVCVVFIRVAGAVAEMPADALCLSQAAQMILLWGDRAFAETSPLALAKGVAVLKPEVGAVIRAAYDPALPAAGEDPSLALRLYARTLAGGAA
ncbi:hypothetical protein [Marivivens marinus]|uniref:hypothetical protein n=1 Tax=Marivivens marinus TaxID=3110173 RepID=UPI003B8490DA